jgi:hypothetical protein
MGYIFGIKYPKRAARCAFPWHEALARNYLCPDFGHVSEVSF